MISNSLLNTDYRTSKFVKVIGVDKKMNWMETESKIIFENVSVYEMLNALCDLTEIMFTRGCVTFEDFMNLKWFDSIKIPYNLNKYFLDRCWCMGCMELSSFIKIDYYLPKDSNRLYFEFNFVQYPCDSYEVCYQ